MTNLMASNSTHFARREIKLRRRTFRKHWRFFAALVLGLSGSTALLTALLLGDRRIPVWMLGPVCIGFAFWAARSQFDGTYHLQSGLDAEGWTSEDLRKALGPKWHVIDWISFGEHGDVDHVVVGPAGVFAIETKYTDSSLDSRTGRETVQRWIDQSHTGARRVRLLLTHHYGRKINVTPWVVLSGAATAKLEPGIEDVHVVRRGNLGSLTARWRSSQPLLSSEEVEEIRTALLGYRGIREEFERNRSGARHKD